MGCIYMITNKINNEKYIGQTLNFIKRKKDHICNSKNDKISTHLYLAMKKYGIDNFIFEILENNIDKDDLDNKEIFYIEKFNTFHNGYNMTVGGENVIIHNPEIKEKISKTIKRHWENGVYNYRKTNITKALKVAHENASQRAKKMWENEDIRETISKKISQKLSKNIIAYNETKILDFNSYQEAINYFAKMNIKLHKSQITRAKQNRKKLFNYYWKGPETIERVITE